MKPWTQDDLRGKPEHIRRQLEGQAAKRHKYRAKQSSAASGLWPELAGRSFPSGLQRERAQELVLLERAGEISNLEHEKTIKLTAGITYRVDFVYIEQGRTVWEDAKGKETDLFKIKKKLWRVHGPGLLRITKRDKRGGIRVTDTVMPRAESE